MNLTINYVSRNRNVGKAMRRVRPLLDGLLSNLDQIDVKPPYNDVVLWIADFGRDHYEEVEKTQDFLSVFVGRPEDLGFTPADDPAFLSYLIDRIAFFASNSDMASTERDEILQLVQSFIPNLDYS